jgi:8-oxo-dGTP pyrophosphatase MutT (NUDIX family)
VRREISAGCVIYRRDGVEIEVALIRPKGRDCWTLPKGLLEAGEPPELAAARETREETGLEGNVLQKIETIKYTYTAKWENPPERIFKIVTFYLMELTGGDPARHDSEVDAIEWFPIDQAVMHAAYSSDKQVLRKTKMMLGVT